MGKNGCVKVTLILSDITFLLNNVFISLFVLEIISLNLIF